MAQRAAQGECTDVDRPRERLLRDGACRLASNELLSAHNRILFDVEIARGEATSLPVHPREVFRPLIRHGAVGGILVHNHPSGDPTPSEDDIALTRLVAVGEVVGIPLIDHLVVASGGFTSLATLLGTEYRT